MKLLPHWRVLWRAWSVRLNALGFAFYAWLGIDPTGVLTVWNMMPAPVRGLIPEQLVSALGAILFALAFFAKFVSQPKLQEKINAAKE